MGGEIFGIWSANSTFTIKEDVEVPIGKTLEIKEGVVIKLYAGVRITVRGNLIAQGTIGNPIRFIPNNTNALWNNIAFKTNEKPVLKYCLFEGTDKSYIRADDYTDLFGALNFSANTSIESITDCIFRNNRAGAIYISGSETVRSMHFEGLAISGGENFGIVFRGGNYNSLSFNNNTIEGNLATSLGFTGIRIEKIHAEEISLRGNKLSQGLYRLNEHYGGALIIESPEISEVNSVILENELYEETEGKKAAAYVKARKITINNSVFKNNYGTEGGGCFLIGDSIDISATEFSGNTIFNGIGIFNGGGGLTIATENPDSWVTITNSKFLNNTFYGYDGGGFRLTGSGSSLKTMLIQGCEFTNNFSNYNGGGIGISDFSLIREIHINSNSFENNKTRGSAGGSGVWIDRIGEIVTFNLQGSTKIGNHLTEYGNGGFLSINSGVGRIGNLNYLNNNHEGYSEASGNGGLFFMNPGFVNNIFFNGNKGISGKAGKSGGVVYCRTITKIGSVTINDNKSLVSRANNGNGGTYSFECLTFDDVRFTGNNADTTRATVDGGFLYLKINSQQGGSVSISGNTVAQLSACGGEGGSYYLDNSGSFSNLVFRDNTFKESVSGGNGGVLSLNSASGQSFGVQANKVSIAKSGKKGGSFFVSISGNLNSFLLSGNTIGSTESTQEGGFLYLNSMMTNKTSVVGITSNKIDIAKSVQSKGGVLYFAGLINQDIAFSENTIGDASANLDGGLIYCAPGTVQSDKFEFIHNTISGIGKSLTGTGGLLSGEGTLKLIDINGNNNFNKLSSFGSGGGVYWKNSGKISLKITQNTIKESSSMNSTGGFVHLEASGIDEINIFGNSFNSLSASQSGGGFYFNSSDTLAELSVISNSVKGSLSAKGSGGFLCLNNSSGVRKLRVEYNNFSGANFGAALNGGIFSINAGSILKSYLNQNIFEGNVYSKDGGVFYLNANFPLGSNSGDLQIYQNQVNSMLNVTNNGGFIYASGKIDQKVDFQYNEFYKKVRAENAGGIIFLKIENGSSDIVAIKNNKVLPNSESDIFSAKTGGFVHLEGNFHNHLFDFSNNTINKMGADESGGVIRILNLSKLLKQDLIQLADNKFQDMNAGLDGGILSFIGNLSDSLVFRRNTLTRISITGQNNNGGSLYLKNGTDINSVLINSNSSKNLSMVSGGGVFLKFDGKKIGSVRIEKNTSSDLKSKLSGAYDFSIDSLIEFKSTNNSYLNIVGQNGSLYYFTGGSSSYIKSFSQIKDTLKSFSASQNGGVVFFDLPRLYFASFDNLKSEDSFAGSDGGMVAGVEGIQIDGFQFLNTTVDRSRAGKNGGVFAFTGKFGNFNVNHATFTNDSAAYYGGSLYLSGTTGLGNLDVSDCLFMNSCCNSTGTPNTVKCLTGDGGAIYLKSINSCTINNSSFKSLNAKNDGGAIVAKYLNNLRVYHSDFAENGARDKNGGAIYAETIGSISDSGNRFRHNRAIKGLGGGVFITGSVLSMKNDSVYGNVAYRGGGAYLSATSGKIDSLYFAGNHIPDNTKITSFGGGLFVSSNKGKPLEVKDTRIYNNKAYYGGGVFLSNASVRLIRNIFDFNATTEDGDGAAAYFDNSHDTKLYNCIFHANNVARNALQTSLPTAGIHIYYNQAGIDSTEIVNCAFRANNSYALRITTNSAIPVNNFLKTRIRNSILYYNGYKSEDIPQFAGNNHLFGFSFSCVEDLDRKVFGNSNIGSLPYFTSDTIYCLQPFSPCTNRGDSLSVYNDRVNLTGLRNDMGVTGGPFMFDNCSLTLVGPDPLRYEADTVCTGINNLALQDLTLYPNPTKGKLYLVTGTTFRDDFKVQITSSFGKLVGEYRFFPGTQQGIPEIDLSHLPKGIYLVQVNDNVKQIVKKVIVM